MKKNHGINENALLPFCHENYEAPSHADLVLLCDYTGWDQKTVAAAVGVYFDKENKTKGSSTVRRWLSNGKSKRAIDYAKWRCLLFEAGLVKKGTYKFSKK